MADRQDSVFDTDSSNVASVGPWFEPRSRSQEFLFGNKHLAVDLLSAFFLERLECSHSV